MISDEGRVAAVYVWVQLAGEPVVAGRFQHQDNTGVFYYGNSYIQRPDAFALDPVNLPLIPEREFTTQANCGHFGVLLDAGPDTWGKRVLSEISQSRPRNELEYLLAGNGQGVGQLLFSTSSNRIKYAPSTRIPTVDLDSIERAAMLIDQDQDLDIDNLPPPVLRVLEDSSWLGGARPKASVTRGDRQYLAKFSRHSDSYDQVAAEYASLKMARDCLLEVPNFELVKLSDNKKLLLVERFDSHAGTGARTGARTEKRLHYISAHSLLQLERAQETNPDHGYPGLAALMRRFMPQPSKATADLYRRMVFRVLIGDTDDHGRNHGFLFVDQQWQLAPVFDVLPHPDNTAYQAMPIGRHGRARSLENLLSMCDVFLLDHQSATGIIQQVASVVSTWREYFAEAGVPAAQLRRLEPAFALADSAAALLQKQP